MVADLFCIEFISSSFTHMHTRVMCECTNTYSCIFIGVRHVFTQDGNLFLSPAEEERRLSCLNLTELTQNSEAKTESKKVNMTSNGEPSEHK